VKVVPIYDRADLIARSIQTIRWTLVELMLTVALVIMLFLWPELNLKLRPRLLRELPPGTHIVSHWHDMGDWQPKKSMHVSEGRRDHPVYLWITGAAER